ncbi:YcaO-like family protein [Bacillus sp. APMAM]|nr:YcaO-like family protein [Bacillus sp. APMAM]RTZ53740.1 hypothetical protein EKO25_21880 [Bacillus sp. SAJ1]
MKLKYYIKGEPFIGDRFYINRSIFLSQTKQAYISSSTNSASNGHNSHFEIKRVIKSAIGEWIERNTLVKNKKVEQLLAFNMINGKEQLVSSDKIYLIDSGEFNDSCGIASHLDSNSAITSAFMEFFERQSLVFSWITKKPAKIINIKCIKNNKIKDLYRKMFDFVDKIFILDVSLHQDIHTVFVIGYGKVHKSLGLSADFDLERAIISALEEMFQTFADSWTKTYIKEVSNNSYKNNELYMDYYRNISIEQFVDEYRFLWENGNELDKGFYGNHKNEVDFSKSIKLVCQDLKITPYCIYIPCFFGKFKTKIVKVFSPDGYPHMYPKIFSEKETKTHFNKNISYFPNAHRMIPFP